MKTKVLMALIVFGFFQVCLAEDDFDRDPASIGPSVNGLQKAKNFPGSEDEEDLKVISIFPEAPVVTYSRGVQQEVYKELYKKELKDERAEPVEE